MKNLKDLQLDELEQLMVSLGEAKFRAKQIFGWLYIGSETFEDMSNIPAALKRKLQDAGWGTGSFKAEKIQVSKFDGTRKYLFRLEDGNAIESVFMKYKYGNTVCVSSQAGCRMGCRFCASTIGGLSRNLTPGEISEQILAAERDAGKPVNHVVVMGTGEPFDNYDNLSKFIRIINDKSGRNMGMRNITVSTCGLVPMIDKFGKDFPQVNLAISLHASTQEKREKLMPIAKKYSIDEVLSACRYYFQKTGRRLTFEYSLVGGENDSQEDAEELARLIKGLNCHVNLIPVNPIKERNYVQSDKKVIENFQNKLEKYQINVTIRREMGRDIDGACGQLRKRYLDKREDS